MTRIVGVHKEDPEIKVWYTGLPSGDFISENEAHAKQVPNELQAMRIIKRLNNYTSLHGYTFRLAGDA
jgi:hypothetical protein